MKWHLAPAAVLLCVAVTMCCSAAAEQSSEALNILGIRVGQPAEEVRHTLEGKASFAKEEEGQQVWHVLHEPGMQYLILGFDRDRRVRYVTAVAGSEGPPLTCAPLGDASTATRSGKPGNVELRREEKRADADLFIIARGTSPDHLSSCSIKKQGSGMEEDDERDEKREKPRRP